MNPKVQVIIKYPQWYDRFHERGYEVMRETADFDRIWVGTETRDYARPALGRHAAVRGLLHHALAGRHRRRRSAAAAGTIRTAPRSRPTSSRPGRPCWAAPASRCSSATARCCKDTGPKNIEALRQNIPELLAVAEQVGRRETVGVAAYKPANSHPEKEQRVFDFVGMLGLPLVPCHEFPTDAQAAFFSIHALKDPGPAGQARRPSSPRASRCWSPTAWRNGSRAR